MKEKLTVVIFKDHFSSRTLNVSLSWIRRLGMITFSVIFLALLSAILFLKAYTKTSTNTGSALQGKIEELERELADTKASYQSLKATQSGTVSVTGGYFSAIPPSAFRGSLPPRDSLPLRIESYKATWKGNLLKVHTALEYVQDDGGNQQGNFILLARGPDRIFAYPENVFSPAGTDILMRPESGEFFSVSRYREINADFGPVQNRDDIQTIELMIFNTDRQLVLVDRIQLDSLKIENGKQTSSHPPLTPEIKNMDSPKKSSKKTNLPSETSKSSEPTE